MSIEKNDTILKKELGQIFTPSGIVTYMVKQLENSTKYILEPSVGDGAFLEELLKIPDIKIQAIELDPFLVKDVRKKYHRFENVNIQQGSFFDFDFCEYDAVIMNPPYIRHEELVNHSEERIRKSVLQEKIECAIPSQSNLYVYFFVKSLSCLKDGGQLLAIIPSNWMSAKYGKWFKQFMQENFHIRAVTLIKGDVFDGALTDSSIVHLSKKKTGKLRTEEEEKTKFKIGYMDSGTLKTQQVTERSMDALSSDEDWSLFFREKIPMVEKNFLFLKELFDIKRGIGTNWNDFFVFERDDVLIKRYPRYFQRLVTSPKNLDGYSTSLMKTKEYLLCIKGEMDLPSEIKDYVKKFSDILKKERKPKTLFERLIKSPNAWYELRLDLKRPDFIFGYIVRENKKFYLNDARYLVRDNFYELHVKESLENSLDKHVLLSILNSIVAEYNLEFIGRDQGGGLKKIQKYEFEHLKVINPFCIEPEDYKELQVLGKKLAENNSKGIVKMIKKRIDKIVWPYYNPNKSLEYFEKELEDEIRKRLRR